MHSVRHDMYINMSGLFTKVYTIIPAFDVYNIHLLVGAVKWESNKRSQDCERKQGR